MDEVDVHTWYYVWVVNNIKQFNLASYTHNFTHVLAVQEICFCLLSKFNIDS